MSEETETYQPYGERGSPAIENPPRAMFFPKGKLYKRPPSRNNRRASNKHVNAKETK